MTILAIDTSHPVGSAALQRDGREPDVGLFGIRSTHLLEIADCVESLLDRAGAEASDIDRLAVVVGPGSFTGLRIGLAFVKGLYAAIGSDVVTMTSLELLALPRLGSTMPEGVVCAMIDAGKSEVYAAVYASAGDPHGGYRAPRRVAGPPRSVEPAGFLSSLAAGPMTFVGSGVVRYRAMIVEKLGAGARFASDPEHQPSTAALCAAAASLTPLSRDEMLGLEPYYMRPSDAELGLLRSVRVHGERESRTDE
jgi:tRNA threonylcarbamoyladenosine biosynthesis protein TsaB